MRQDVLLVKLRQILHLHDCSAWRRYTFGRAVWRWWDEWAKWPSVLQAFHRKSSPEFFQSHRHSYQAKSSIIVYVKSSLTYKSMYITENKNEHKTLCSREILHLFAPAIVRSFIYLKMQNNNLRHQYTKTEYFENYKGEITSSHSWGFVTSSGFSLWKTCTQNLHFEHT